MSRRFTSADVNPSILEDRTVAVIGYGNQGRSQALNLRDSGASVVIGNRDDEYRDIARADGMEVLDIADAAARGDIVMVILPDEVQPGVYREHIEPAIREGSALTFAHGYDVHFGLIEPRADLDVLLIAPKMIGDGVRRRYESGEGFVSVVAAHRDVSGNGLATAVALAAAIGSGQRGIWETTFEEETVTDLYGEQIGGAAMLGALMASFETLTEAGYDPEVVSLELFASGELVEVQRAAYEIGVLGQLSYHSPASRYGQLSRVPRVSPPEIKETMKAVLGQIRDGSFARELAEVESGDYTRIDELRERYAQHPVFRTERGLRSAMGLDGRQS
ncbi:ketol-acid reductoisomerase [Dactylosporangium sp. CA-233914]|uniref:ketol-acid reductoisomerase n=1 Tax=Dactylosporangium sp. CA-233914 TaxID=3239934 RepID=UPI003D922B43